MQTSFGLEVRCQVYERRHTYSELLLRIYVFTPGEDCCIVGVGC